MGDDQVQKKIEEVEAIYKKVMDQLEESRKEQFRIIDEYLKKLKEDRLKELESSFKKL